MFRIRSEQIEAIELARVRARARELAGEFRTRLRPAVAADDERLLIRIVGDALARAWGYGLRADSDLRAFAQLAWSVSARFDEHPPFAAVFSDPSIDPANKLPRLWDAATSEDWLAAAGGAG